MTADPPCPIEVVHLALAPAAPPAGDEGDVHAWLQRWWWAAAVEAGMEAADGALPPDLDVAYLGDDVWLDLLAARRRSDGSGSAVAFRTHDVVGVLVSIAVSHDDDVTKALHTLPSLGEAPPPLAALGELRLVVAAAPDPGELDVGDVLRAVGFGGEGLRLGAVTDAGVLIAEVEADARRTLAVVVPDAARDQAHQVVGMAPGPELGQLVRYLIHASKLRYLTGIFQAELPTVQESEARSDRSLRELFRLHEALEGPSARLDRALFDAGSRLGRAQGDAAGLAVLATGLRDLSRSAQTATRNLRVHAPAGVRPANGTLLTMFARDTELADWLHEAVEQELGYLETVKERAHEAQELTRLRLDQAAEEQARLGNWLSVLQTSVLAAVLGGLGVVEAFGAPFEATDGLTWAALATVALLSLLLPPLALRWVGGTGAIDIAAGAACGAAVAWTTAVALDAPSTWVAVAVGAGGILGAEPLRLRRRHQRMSAPDGEAAIA